VLRAYDHGAGADEPLVWYEAVPGGVSRRYLHADHQGSIVAVADQNGNPIAVNGYDPWGIPNASNLGRFGYTGQAWLPELGLWYYKARIYSPTLGRFLQTDPVGYKDQVNLYAYVGDDPVDGRDPTGLETFDCLSGVGKGNCSRGTILKDGDLVKTRYGEFVIGHGDGFTIATPIASGQSQLSQTQLTNVVFNETKSLRGDRVDWARRDAAHVIANGDADPGPRGRPVHAVDTATSEETRSQVYRDTARAVRRTMAERSLGFDPTFGARHFNIRPGDGTGPWRGLPMVTHEGPLNNSYTKGDVPASSGIYLNTYGGPTDW
jgi:RHS repeat-associated protein